MSLPPIPAPDAWLAQPDPDADEQAWQAGPWRIAILPDVPGQSLRRLSLSLEGGPAAPWRGLAEALPPGPLDAQALDALLRRHRLAEATLLLQALTDLARDALARLDAPEGEMVVQDQGVAARAWPIRLGRAAFAPVARVRDPAGWTLLLGQGRALGHGPTGGLTALSGRHMPLAPHLLSAHARLAAQAVLAPLLEPVR